MLPMVFGAFSPVLSVAGELTPAAMAERTATRIELGRRLFFDPVLSRDRTVSCTSCHKPEYAFADCKVATPQCRQLFI